MPPSKSTLSIGTAKEQVALQFLELRGLQLVEHNVRYKCGEIDLIMRDVGYLVFVEVRYRRNCNFGTPQESIGWVKRQHLRRAAQQYLQHNPTKLACRFDVVAITGANSIEWLQDAFRDG